MGVPDDSTRLDQVVGIAVFVAIITGVFGPSEADCDRGRTVKELGRIAQLGVAAVVAKGVPENLTCLAHFIGIAFIVTVVTSVRCQ